MELTGSFKLEYHYDENDREKMYEIDFDSEDSFNSIRYSKVKWFNLLKYESNSLLKILIV